MVSICLYFQVHQPFRYGKYSVFDIGENHDYFDNKLNKEIMKKVVEKSYLPTNKLLLELIKKHDKKFKIAFSITGTTIEQFKEYAPKVLESFKELAKTGSVEFLSETYYHSLSYLYSKDEFREQVKKHKNLIKDLFGQTPFIFRNTELIFNNELTEDIEKLGFKGILTEGVDELLGWKSPNYIYKTPMSKVKVLLRNYKLSDDIALRFSDKSWSEYPLSAEKFVKWINGAEGEILNLFMDYATFGEYQQKETGIFSFLEELPERLLKEHNFVTPSEAIEKYNAKAIYDTQNFISWSNKQKDIFPWTGSKMQQEAIEKIYSIENKIKNTDDKDLLADWRKMQSSDHFYHISTKFFTDDNNHHYFNPYESPYEAFIAFMNILKDLIARVNQEKKLNIIPEIQKV